MKRRRPFIAALLVACVASAAMPMAAAQGAASPQRADEQDVRWQQAPRTVQLDHDADGFRYESRLDSAVGQDRITLGFDLDDAALQYEFVSTQPGNETILRATLDFVALVEFRDRDRDGRYGLGDEAVQRLVIADLPEARIDAQPQVANGLRTVHVSYALPADDDGGPLPPVGSDPPLAERLLRLEFTFSPRTTFQDGRNLAPTEVRFGIAVEGFPFVANGTRLALETNWSTRHALAATTDLVAAQRGLFDAAYSWDDGARADGILGPVGLTVLESFGTEGVRQALVLFAYPRAATVEHEAGIQTLRYQAIPPPPLLELLARGDWFLYSIGIFISLAVVATPAYLRLRRAS